MKIYTDLSNLMKVNFITGIQRVVREIIIRMLKNGKYDLVLMIYIPEKRTFIRLDNEKFYDFFALGKGEKNRIATADIISADNMESGAVFFDIDSVWNTRMRRSYLFPILKSRGIKIATQLYDLIPIQHPQYCHENTVLNFMVYTGANINYADLIITSAQATVKQLDILTDKLSAERKKSVVVPLGCDFNAENNHSLKACDNVKNAVSTGRYILMVGTIEPRKNHKIVLDALDAGMGGVDMNVIFAGRIGWNVSELENRIRNHKLNGTKLFYFDSASDDDIDYLYKNAFAVAFPTYNEGFGLPVIEAFQRNTPVFASDIEVLHEVAGDFADYFDNTDVNSFIQTVKKYADDEEKYKQLKANISSFVPYTWDKSADDMMKHLDSLFIKSSIRPPETVRQMAVLTARNDDILATLPYIDKYMNFIEEIVICCPPANVDELKSRYKGRIELKFLTDDELLAGNPLPDDHTTRNFFLRCLMMQNDIFDDVFIMTDDDYRPLCEIGIDTFIKDGRYQAYHCYDLSEWKGTYGNYTSFDTSMFRTYEFLTSSGFPTYQYSSHQPQIIDRRIYREMLEKNDGIQLKGLDEWSTYFNYGAYFYSDIFEPMTYVSMCWPGARSDWDLFEQPKKFLFENHYSVLYQKGGIFEEFSESLNENTAAENMEKAVIYSKELQKQYEGRNVYNAYCRIYEHMYNERPSYTVYVSGGNLAFHVPVNVEFKNDTWNRIPLYITDDVYNKSGAEKVIFSYYFSDYQGGLISDMVDIRIKKGDTEVYVPLRVNLTSRKCVLNVKFTAENKNEQVSATVHAVIV
jgi:glycosyltransferase involved in cell wall biosynthesis